jgi:hypothetical protein
MDACSSVGIYDLEGFFSFSNMKVENAHVGQFSKDMLRVLV